MQIRQLRYFITLVEKHSFTDAARECFVTQSALSQQISSMEQELEVELVKRNGRMFTITPAGKLFYQRAVKINQEVEELTLQVQRVSRNLGASLRLGLLSSMDKDKLATELQEQVLNRTGFELSLLYGSHDELYDLFGNACISAFISDENRLSATESFNKIKLFGSKMYAEIPRTIDINHSGISKLKLDNQELKKLKLYIICENDHADAEQDAIKQLLGLSADTTIDIVASVNEGRKAVLSHGNAALIVDRSLMRGDFTTHNKLFRYEITKDGKSIKRQLCCYARKNLSLPELQELCTILMELGHKKGSLEEAKQDLIGYTAPSSDAQELSPTTGYSSNHIPL